MNNKKLFKGALVLFASILMAVSCSAGDKTGNNDNTNNDDTDTTKKVVTLAQVQAAIRTLGNVTTTGNAGSVDFSEATVSAASKVDVIAKKGTTLTAATIKTALKAKVDNLTLANTTVANNLDSGFTGNTDQKARTFTITFTANEGYSFEGFTEGVSGQALTITVSVLPKDTAGSEGENWA